MTAPAQQRPHTTRHTCHWPGCPVEVPPKLWGCKPHWFALPKRIRNRIWATYRPGQEITATPSPAYLAAAGAAQAWIVAHGAATGPQRPGRQQTRPLAQPSRPATPGHPLAAENQGLVIHDDVAPARDATTRGDR